MVEKKKSKNLDISEEKSQSSDDKIALVIMNFFIDVFYSIFFIVLAYMSFWIIVVLSVLGFVVRAVGSEQPDELKIFTLCFPIYEKAPLKGCEKPLIKLAISFASQSQFILPSMSEFNLGQ